MGENRYRPFKDKKMDHTWVRRGTNQKEGPYMGENVPPTRPARKKSNLPKLKSREGLTILKHIL